MGKGSVKQEVNEFYMSIHLGLCNDELDAITGLFVGEKLAWEGEATTEGGVYVDAPSLFGGPKQEGGVGGIMYYLPGGRNQIMPASLAQRLGLTPNTCPAYRGVASVFFIGSEAVNDAGSVLLLILGGGSTGDYSVGGDGSTSTGGGGSGNGGGITGRNQLP